MFQEDAEDEDGEDEGDDEGREEPSTSDVVNRLPTLKRFHIIKSIRLLRIFFFYFC